MKRFITLLALAVAALSVSATVALAGPGSGGHGTITSASTFTASYFQGDIGGQYTCTGTRYVKTNKPGHVISSTDVETCSLSDISHFAAGTYTGVYQLLGGVWSCRVPAGTYAAVYTVPSYPLYAANTTVCGVDVSGQVVPWIWYTDYPGATPNGGIATGITLSVTADGSGGGTLNIVASYK